VIHVDMFFKNIPIDIQNPPVIPGEDWCEFGTPKSVSPQEMLRGSPNIDPHKVFIYMYIRMSIGYFPQILESLILFLSHRNWTMNQMPILGLPWSQCFCWRVLLPWTYVLNVL